MEKKNEIVFVKDGEHGPYKLSLPSNANLGEAYSAVAEFLNEIVVSINEYNKRCQEALDKEEKADEPPPADN